MDEYQKRFLEELKTIIEVNVDDIISKLNKPEESKISKIDIDNDKNSFNLPINKKNNIIYSNEIIYNHGNYTFEGQLLNSNDISTHNLGVILNRFKTFFPNIYMQVLNEVSTKIIYDQYNNPIYTGTLDIIKTDSTIGLTEQLLSKNESFNTGVSFLIKILTENNTDDFEFFSLISAVRAHAPRMSDRYAFESVITAFISCYETGDKQETLDNTRKLYALITWHNLDFKITSGISFYNYQNGINEIYLNNNYLTNSIIMHEFGHAIDRFYGVRNKNEKNEVLFEKARNNIRNNPKTKDLLNIYQKKIQDIYDAGNLFFDNLMLEKYGTFENIFQAFDQYIIYKINNGQLEYLFQECQVPNDLKNSILNDLNLGTLNIRTLSIQLYNLNKSDFINKYIYTKIESNLLDIFSAIFGSNVIDLANGEKIYLMVGHSKEYYNSYNDASMTEIYANINSLLVQGSKELLEVFRELVGDEFYNEIMKEHNARRIITPNQEKKETRKVSQNG